MFVKLSFKSFLDISDFAEVVLVQINRYHSVMRRFPSQNNPRKYTFVLQDAGLFWKRHTYLIAEFQPTDFPIWGTLGKRTHSRMNKVVM